MASIYDSLVEGTMGLVKGLPEHLQDTEQLAQLGLPAEDYNVISAMNAADNMNAGLGSLIAPGALYTLGDTIANPNQGLVEGVQDFGRYMKGVNIQSNPELAKQLMGQDYVNRMQGKYALAMDAIGKGIFGKGPNPDLYNQSTPQDLGFIDNATTIKEAVAPVGITDRGRGMATPGTSGAFEMIGGQAVPVGDVLGRQMALEKADFFEEAKPKFGAGELLSLVGLLTQSRPIQAIAGLANRDRISSGFGKIKSGIGSLGSNFARKMRGVNPDGTTRTQRQYEAAREQRRRDRRVENMLERKAAGKSYSQKNLNELTTGGSKPGTYTAKGAGSGGKSSGKIVCTMMNESYGFGNFRNKIWLKHSRDLPKEYEVGYHTIFLPLVKFAKGKGKLNKIVKKTLEHIARHRTYDLKQEMKGKTHLLGRAYRKALEPLCFITGKIKSALGRE